MPPRFMWAVGLSGLSSSDLGGGKSLVKVAKVLIDAGQVHGASSGLSSVVEGAKSLILIAEVF